MTQHPEAEMESDRNLAIVIRPLVSSHPDTLGEPLVHMSIPQQIIQESPSVIRSIAQHLLAAAEAAEHDSFLFQWTYETFGRDMVSSANMLNEYRLWRQRKGYDGDGAWTTEPEPGDEV